MVEYSDASNLRMSEKKTYLSCRRYVQSRQLNAKMQFWLNGTPGDFSKYVEWDKLSLLIDGIIRRDAWLSLRIGGCEKIVLWVGGILFA